MSLVENKFIFTVQIYGKFTLVDFYSIYDLPFKFYMLLFYLNNTKILIYS